MKKKASLPYVEPAAYFPKEIREKYFPDTKKTAPKKKKAPSPEQSDASDAPGASEDNG
ncbi:MAG: hypothetical protein IK104_00155 [Clostridia bacterium]|nr:hypothetical protein [Clostridia bacterium]